MHKANKRQQPPLQGAYTSRQQLIDARLQARELKLKRKKPALAQLAGGHHSRFRGRGLDFEEVRPYAAGDDVRSIDWRVTARAVGTYTKLFSEERERPVLIACDQRQSLFFGSQHCFKSVTAAHLAALLAWATLAEGDRIGFSLFNDEDHWQSRPKQNRRSLLAALSQLESYNSALNIERPPSDGSASLVTALAELKRIAQPGSTLYFISDFDGWQQECLERLYQIARHTEVIAFQVSDPLEWELPKAGRYGISNGRERRELDTGSAKIRRDFAQQRREQQQALNTQLGRLAIPLIEISTASHPLQQLAPYFGGRS